MQSLVVLFGRLPDFKMENKIYIIKRTKPDVTIRNLKNNPALIKFRKVYSPSFKGKTHTDLNNKFIQMRIP